MVSSCLSPVTLVRGLAHGLALQVAQGADLLFPEDLVTPEVQPAQDRDRCAGVHPEDESGCEVPAEIHLAMCDHIGSSRRFGGFGPAYMCFRQVHIADIGKAFGSQQFLKDLRGDAGDGVFFETDRGGFRWQLCGERLAPGTELSEAHSAGECSIGQEPAATLARHQKPP